MPTKRIFILSAIVFVGGTAVLGGAKLWAHKTLGEGNRGIARPIAEAVVIL